MNKFLFLILVLTTSIGKITFGQLTDPNPAKSISICDGKKGLTQISLLPVDGGAPPTYYEWEMSSDTTAGWNIITGQNNEDLYINIQNTIFLRRVYYDRGGSVKSKTLTYAVLPPLFGGEITSGKAKICNGESLTLEVLKLPSGADGNINYEWTIFTNGNSNTTGITTRTFNTGKVSQSASYYIIAYSPYCKSQSSSNQFEISSFQNIKYLKLLN